MEIRRYADCTELFVSFCLRASGDYRKWGHTTAFTMAVRSAQMVPPILSGKIPIVYHKKRSRRLPLRISSSHGYETYDPLPRKCQNRATDAKLGVGTICDIPRCSIQYSNSRDYHLGTSVEGCRVREYSIQKAWLVVSVLLV